jgi:integrase
MCKKTGSEEWKQVYNDQSKAVTIGEIFTDFTNNVLANKLNILTEKRYKSVMRACLKVFLEDTPANSIRTMKRYMVPGGEKKGWEIFKAHNYLLSRRTVNSYFRDLRHIFNWAKATAMIRDEVITKHDRYSESEMHPLDKKVWTRDEMVILLNHSGLSEYMKDLMKVFILTGCRVSELLGFNYLNRAKEFKWHHVDFKRSIISIMPKQKRYRVERRVHSSVMAIFKKWLKQGFKQPLDFGYDKIGRDIVPMINEITGIKFTMHDLRRLNAQLARPSLGIEGAAKSIGDSSLDVVDKHYAGISNAEMDQINDVVYEELNMKYPMD